MARNTNNFVNIYDIFDNPSFLDYEENSEFLEWYSTEGSKRISELTRQLRSFLNYKSVVIRLRFSKTQEDDIILKKDPKIKWETEFFSLSSQYANLLNLVLIW